MPVRIIHGNTLGHSAHIPTRHERRLSEPPDKPVRTYCWCGYVVEET